MIWLTIPMRADISGEVIQNTTRMFGNNLEFVMFVAVIAGKFILV